MASLPAHRSLVRYYGYFVRRRMGYIVMERVPGPSLKRLVRRQGPLSPEKTVSIAKSILAGLDVMHRHGYVHGDLHSKNVIVPNFETATVKIIDFQHAVRIRKSGRARAIRRLPKPPRELAPESRRRFIDVRYDLYSVGFMCATMLLGRPPRRKWRIRSRRFQPQELWSVIRKATHPRPRERYGSAKEMMQALNAALAQINESAATES